MSPRSLLSHGTMLLAGIIIAATFSLAFAWTGPTSAPPNGNVSPPVNVGTTNQVKNAGLAVNSLAVFGNSILSGTSRYLNFGTLAGSSGYGIRDNAGVMEVKSSGGSWAPIAGGGASQWTTSGSNIYYNTGNVGVGTTNPSARLESYGSGLGLYLNQPSAADLYLRYHVPGVRWWTVGPKANGDFWFSNSSTHTTDAGTPPLVILNGGNVGIGTSNPGQKLDVTGNIRATGEHIGTLGSGYGQFRMIAGNYGAMWRNDGANTYFLLTATGDQYGTWNTLRPLTINDATGNVSIGTALTVTGNVTAAGFFHSSDANLKKNIETSKGVDIISKLRGVTFDWKKDGAPSAGVIAQEVEAVMPSAVHTDPQTGLKSVEYDQLIAPLIEAVKDLEARDEVQQAEITSLMYELETLKASR